MLKITSLQKICCLTKRAQQKLQIFQRLNRQQLVILVMCWFQIFGHTLKRLCIAICEGGCSTDVLCFVPKILELSAYLYCTLYADKFFDFMVAGSKGTKIPRGDKKQIMTYSVCLPSENELKNFNAAVLPMFQLIESNRRENARLSLLRDTLLPKLMAGEI